jgi:hypothetical protein
MKQKLNKITSVILFCLVLIFSGCVRDELPMDNTMINQEPKIAEAKNWFEDYKAKESFHPIFADINYHWENASIVILEDGSKAVTVPITDMNTNPEYKGERVLYLYPFEESYDAVVYELSPDSNQAPKSVGFKNLESYNGYISTWDLKKGFIKAQKFTNSTATKAVVFKVVSDEDLKLHKSTSKIIDLDEVIIEGPGGGGGDYLYYSYVLSGGSFGSNNIGGSNTDNYFNPPHGGGGTSSSSTKPTIDDAEKNPCDKIKKLKDDIKHMKALAELKKNLKLQYETGYYISKSKGYVAGTPDSNLALTGTRYSDSYGIMHVHEDTFTHQVNNGGIRPEIVKPIHMFSPKDVNTFCSLLITANKYKTSSLDEIFNEMVSGSGTYQLRFEGDINDVKNFDFDSLSKTYVDYMKPYKDDLESGFLSFMKEYIGINGITLYKINEDGTSESKTLSVNNQLTTNPC